VLADALPDTHDQTKAISGGTRNRPGRAPNPPTPPTPSARAPGPRRIATPLLDKFGDDISKRAHEGKVDAAFGRDKEIEQVVQTLIRRTKSNPVLIGDPGVGKTAIVEELARQIDVGLIPELEGKRIVSLSVGNLLAGTKLRGDLEERVKGILEEAKNSPHIILFIDEIHSVVAAGGSESGSDISNMLKPDLARGKIKVIGATTIDEYRQHIERDPALERRFRPVTVGEPSKSDLMDILMGVKSSYETFHGVTFPQETITAVAQYSDRYIPDRHQPDKAIDLIDETGSRVKFRKHLDKTASTVVTEADVAAVISSLRGIPIGSIKLDKLDKVRELEPEMKRLIIGQEGPIEELVKAEKREIAGVRDPKRPYVMFFLGATGTGKTYTTQVFSDLTNRPLIRLDMSEFMEPHSVSKLIGSPPGYIGFQEGGQLTEDIRRNPNAVLLLDEVEKAHRDVHRLFLQVAEDGRLSDSHGRVVDFKNTIIIMTSNVGTGERREQSFGFAVPGVGPSAVKNEPSRSDLQATLLRGGFPPEFINRMDGIAEFKPLRAEAMSQIVGLELKRLERTAEGLGYKLEIEPEVLDVLASRCQRDAGNGRAVRRAVQGLIEDPMSECILRNGQGLTKKVVVKLDKGQIVFEAHPTAATNAQ
jgi:ATP-dependent Clp protease ATP-binding subunit ClpC